jgi:hypothetical protein
VMTSTSERRKRQMINNDATMKEKRDILRNDLRNQGTTFSQFAESDASTPLGRFNAISSPHAVESQAIPKYPAAYHQYDPVPDEPPLGIAINEAPLCGEPHERSVPLEQNAVSPAQGTSGDPSTAPSPLASSRSMSSEVGSPSFRTYRRR